MTVTANAARPADVVTLGEAMALFLADDAAPLSAAALGNPPGFTVSVAGAEATVAIGLARLGHAAAYLGRVGPDALGDMVRSVLRGAGVDTAGLHTDPALATGVIIRDAPKSRPISVIYHRSGLAGSALEPDDVVQAVFDGARALHLTGITAMLSPTARAATDRALALAQEYGLTVFWDPNIRLRLAPPPAWREWAAGVIGQVDVALVGRDELEIIAPESTAALGADVAAGVGSTGGAAPADGVAGLDHTEQAITWLHTQGVHTVVVKDGARGAFVDITDPESGGPATRYHHTPQPIEPVDPVGAGDAFAAGWISAWLDGLEPPTALARATTVAACVVAARTDIAGLPGRADLDALTRAVDVVR